MSSPRMIATRRQQVFMGHICSNCGCPVVTIVQIEAQAQKTYSYSQSKAAQIASDTADSAIIHEIMRIEACCETKTVLIGKEKKKSMISPGYFCDSSISGFDEFCPNCRNIEPWQSKSSQAMMNDLKEENFPVIFKSPELANKWACSYIYQVIEQIIQNRQDPQLVQKAIYNSVELTRKIEKARSKIEEIPELQEKKKLLNRINELQKQKANLGFLDIRGKKENSTQIKMIELKLKDIDTRFSIQEKPLKNEIQTAEIMLQREQAIAFGCSNEIITKQLGKTLSYHYKPYSIPLSILNERTLFDIQPEPERDKVAVKLGRGGCGKEKNDIKKFCRKCGCELLPDSIFCSRCGTKIE